MKNCLIIINNSAGGSKNISFEKVEKCLGADYTFTHFLLPNDGEYNIDGYDAVAICGGDGSLSGVLSAAAKKHIDVFYFPSGTLNDRAKAMRYSHAKTQCPSCTGKSPEHPTIVGNIENMQHADEKNTIFSYVFAAGTFTPIGYTTNIALKKKLGIFAYICEVLKEYKIHRMSAQICVGQQCYQGDYTLIMLIKSPRCFGFPFNKAFDAESASGHLVAIKSPKHGGLIGKIELFFPFFRVFFMGLKKEREGKIIFKKVYNATLTLSHTTHFCRDGELSTLTPSDYRITFEQTACNFCVIDKY